MSDSKADPNGWHAQFFDEAKLRQLEALTNSNTDFSDELRGKLNALVKAMDALNSMTRSRNELAVTIREAIVDVLPLVEREMAQHAESKQ